MTAPSDPARAQLDAVIQHAQIAADVADWFAPLERVIVRAVAVLEELEGDEAEEFARTLLRVITEGFAGFEADHVIRKAQRP